MAILDSKNYSKNDPNMKLIVRVLIVCVGIGLLIGIRAYEQTLFMDPLIHYFKGEYHTAILPQVNTFQLIVDTTYRYLLNTICSLLILYGVFNNREVLRFSALIYGFLWVVLIGLYFTLWNLMEGNNLLITFFFYIRRFLIQPILLLLLLPAFYLYKKKELRQ